MIFQSINKKIANQLNKLKNRYERNEAVFVFTIFNVLLFTICTAVILNLIVSVYNENLFENRKTTAKQLETTDSEISKKLEELEEKLGIRKIEDSDEEEELEDDLDNYKKELDSLINTVNKNLDSKYNQDYLRYKLSIYSNTSENNSTIRIIDSDTNEILGEKIVNGKIEGEYGLINVTSNFYQKVFFSIDPDTNDCTSTSTQEALQTCLNELKSINELYGEVGGLWYFDLKTKDFVQLAKLKDIYSNQ